MRIHLFSLLICLVCLFGCSDTPKNKTDEAEVTPVIEVEPDMRYGYDYNQYTAKLLKIKRGDSFGAILERNGIDYPQVYEVLQKIKGKVNIRVHMMAGSPIVEVWSGKNIEYLGILQP